ncbi:translation initiation factor IF-5A [Candidatus Woesearchaeota archaeon]|nr:translation initiation factor IF-5A [Candidatus Woesearchaeota archaeon]
MQGETKVADVSTIKKGSYMLIDGEACKVNSVQVSRPGKHGHAKFRIEAVGLIDGKKRDIVMPHGSVEVPIIDKRNAQVLSISGNMANVMDSETYETFDMEIPEELKDQVKEGSSVLYWVVLNSKVMQQVKPE